MDYGSYFKSTVIREEDMGNTVPQPGIKRRFYQIHMPFPEIYSLLVTPKMSEVTALLKAYANLLTLRNTLYYIEQGTHSREKKIDYIFSRWEGPKPVLSDESSAEVNLLNKIHSLIRDVEGNIWFTLCRRCEGHIDKWWQPDIFDNNIYLYLEKFCKSSDSVWGAYYVTWKLDGSPAGFYSCISSIPPDGTALPLFKDLKQEIWDWF